LRAANSGHIVFAKRLWPIHDAPYQTGAFKGKRMMTTSRQNPIAEKPARSADTMPQHDPEHSGKPSRNSRVEPFDWRGEGVVGNNHTD